jgi:hypothetical protein
MDFVVVLVALAAVAALYALVEALAQGRTKPLRGSPSREGENTDDRRPAVADTRDVINTPRHTRA